MKRIRAVRFRERMEQRRSHKGGSTRRELAVLAELRVRCSGRRGHLAPRRRVPLTDEFCGEPGGCLGDPFGNQWMLSAGIEIVTPAELAAREPA